MNSDTTQLLGLAIVTWAFVFAVVLVFLRMAGVIRRRSEGRRDSRR